MKYTWTFEIFGLEFTQVEYITIMVVIGLITFVLLMIGLWKMGKGQLGGLRREDVDAWAAQALAAQEAIDRGEIS